MIGMAKIEPSYHLSDEDKEALNEMIEESRRREQEMEGEQ